MVVAEDDGIRLGVRSEGEAGATSSTACLIAFNCLPACLQLPACLPSTACLPAFNCLPACLQLPA